MRVRGVAVLLTAAIGVALFPMAPAPAGQPIGHPLDRSISVADYAQLAAFQSLEAFGAPDAYISTLRSQRAPREPKGYFMSKSPDLTGDGNNDLLGFRPEEQVRGEPGPAGGTVVGIDGATGDLLWSFTEEDVYLWAVPHRLGPDGERGVLVLAFRWDWRDAHVAATESIETRLIALDSAGNEIWRRSFDGDVVYSMAAHIGRNLTYPSGTLEAEKGKASDILVASRDVMATPLSWDTSLEAMIVDGATGKTRSAAEEREAESEMSLAAVPDLDADERDDILFLGWSEDDGPWMRARSSADGNEIWDSTARVGVYVTPDRAGDLNGDGTSDLLFSSGCDCVVVEAHASSSRSVRSGGFYGGGGRTALVDGATGDLLWEKRMGAARVAGDIDRDGDPDIAGQLVDWRRSRVSITYMALNGSGSTLYRRSYKVTSEGESAGDVDAYSSVGDVDLDGITDAAHTLAFADLEKEKFSSDRGLVSGRDGTKRWSRAPGRPLFASVDGNGPDLVDTDSEKGDFRLTVQDGGSGLPLWDASLNRPRGGQMAFGSDLNGDGLAEVVLTFVRWGRRFTATTVVLDGLDGDVLWRL